MIKNAHRNARFFIGYQEISRQQAELIEKRNYALLAESEKTGDITKLCEIKFITVINA